MKPWIGAILFVGGMALAGSDGELFPLPNVAGILMLVILTVFARRLEEK